MRTARMAGAVFIAIGIVQLISAMAVPGANWTYAILANLDDVAWRGLLALVFIAIGWYLWSRDDSV